MDNCFSCGKSENMVRDCLMTKKRGGESNQTEEGGVISNYPTRTVSMLSSLGVIKRFLQCCYGYVASIFN